MNSKDELFIIIAFKFSNTAESMFILSMCKHMRVESALNLVAMMVKPVDCRLLYAIFNSIKGCFTMAAAKVLHESDVIQVLTISKTSRAFTASRALAITLIPIRN